MNHRMPSGTTLLWTHRASKSSTTRRRSTDLEHVCNAYGCMHASIWCLLARSCRTSSQTPIVLCIDWYIYWLARVHVRLLIRHYWFDGRATLLIWLCTSTKPNQTRYCPKYEVSFFLEKPALAGMITTFAPLLFVALLSILNVMNADGEGAYETLSRRLLFNPIKLDGVLRQLQL